MKTPRFRSRLPRAAFLAAALLVALLAAPRPVQAQAVPWPAAVPEALSAAAGKARARAALGPAPVPFAIQVYASPDSARVTARLDSLRRLGVPAYRTATQRAGPRQVSYHRLRLGPFASRDVAEAFADCQPTGEKWFVPAAAADSAAAPRFVRGVAADVVPLRPRSPRYLLGRRHASAALLMPARGARGAGAPATLRVYAPGRTSPAVVRYVTGLGEADSGWTYGQAVRVFTRRRGASAAQRRTAVEAFSREYGLDTALVAGRLASYAGGRVARFTVEGHVPLFAEAPALRARPGFDYIDARGRRVYHWQQPGEERAAGNAHARPLQREGPSHARTQRTSLLARPAERGEHAQVCILFF